MNTLTYTFTKDDVTVGTNSYYVTITHNLGKTDYLVVVVNPDDEVVNTSNLIAIGSNTVRIYTENNIFDGTYTVYIYYSSYDNLQVKRLFEQPLVNNPAPYFNYKIPFALPNGDIKNMTLAEFKSFCQATLDVSVYAARENNLSDLQDAVTARQNLDVYSKSEVDNRLADMYTNSGYIQSISLFTTAQGLTNPQTVNIYRDFCGFSADLTGTLTNSETDVVLGTVTITPLPGHTVTFQSPVGFPLYMWDSTNTKYNVGQLTVTFNNNIATFRAYAPRINNFGTSDATIKVTIRCNVISHT